MNLQAAALRRTILPGADRSQAHLFDVIFTQETSPWLGPIIDRDPKVPLSERLPVENFDGARNYLTWLAKADLAELTVERFANASGTAIAPLIRAALRVAAVRATDRGGRGRARSGGVSARSFSMCWRGTR